MSQPAIADPVLGTLLYKRDWYEWSQWVGRVEFMPGHFIDVVFQEWKHGDGSAEEQLEKVHRLFRTLQKAEHGLRVETVWTLVEELEKWPIPSPSDDDARWEELAAQLRLVRIELHSDNSAGLYYLGPSNVFDGREIHCSAHGDYCTGVSVAEKPPPFGSLAENLVEAVRATELFQAVAKQYTGVEVWKDERHAEDGYEYCWLMAREGKEATNLAYLRRQGTSLQLKIKNVDGETRWLDLAGRSAKQLMKHIAPRWTFS